MGQFARGKSGSGEVSAKQSAVAANKSQSWGESYSEVGSERIPSSAIFRAFRNPFKQRLFQRFLRGEAECVIPTFIPILSFSGRMKFRKCLLFSYL